LKDFEGIIPHHHLIFSPQMEGYLCSQAAFCRHNVHPKEHIEHQANSNNNPWPCIVSGIHGKRPGVFSKMDSPKKLLSLSKTFKCWSILDDVGYDLGLLGSPQKKIDPLFDPATRVDVQDIAVAFGLKGSQLTKVASRRSRVKPAMIAGFKNYPLHCEWMIT
jgi:hypothetical protein